MTPNRKQVRRKPAVTTHATAKKPVERTNFYIGPGIDEARLDHRTFQALSVTETVWKDECAKYARLAAERLFGLKYNPADAHLLGERNRIVWDGASKKRMPKLKRGQIIGIYLPESKFLERGWRFTHAALVVKPQMNTIIIAHNTGGILRIDLLDKFLKEKNAIIMQVIAPRESIRFAPGINPEWALEEDERIRGQFSRVFGKRGKKR